MRLKTRPFLISLVLLVGFLLIMPVTLDTDLDRSWTALLSLLPGLGFGLIIATCSDEDRALARGLLFIPTLALLGIAMALSSWVLVVLFGDATSIVLSAYLLSSVLGAYGLVGLIRNVYQVKLDKRQGHVLACYSVASVLPLLWLPLSPLTHGIVAALWVGVLGLGMVWHDGQRRRVAMSRKTRAA